MQTERVKYLFERYFDKSATDEERLELSDLRNNGDSRPEMMQLFAKNSTSVTFSRFNRLITESDARIFT